MTDAEQHPLPNEMVSAVEGEKEAETRQLYLAITELFEPGEIFDLDELTKRLATENFQFNNLLHCLYLLLDGRVVYHNPDPDSPSFKIPGGTKSRGYMK